MKIPRIQTSEPTLKQSYSLKKSTVDRLNQYLECYAAEHGEAPTPKDLVESMLNSFMAEDKDFQKFLRSAATKPAAKPVAPAPSASSGVSGFGGSAPDQTL